MHRLLSLLTLLRRRRVKLVELSAWRKSRRLRSRTKQLKKKLRSASTNLNLIRKTPMTILKKSLLLLPSPSLVLILLLSLRSLKSPRSLHPALAPRPSATSPRDAARAKMLQRVPVQPQARVVPVLPQARALVQPQARVPVLPQARVPPRAMDHPKKSLLRNRPNRPKTPLLRN